MKRLRWAAAALLLTGLPTLTGCGIQPTAASDAGEAPTGIAPGVTLYFINAERQLRPQLRETGRLGTIAEAMTLLLLGPGGSELRTGIAVTSVPRVEATVADNAIQLRVPLAATDVTRRGIDQIVCTALATHVQSGGSPRATVQILFTLASAESDQKRTCPLIG